MATISVRFQPTISLTAEMIFAGNRKPSLFALHVLLRRAIVCTIATASTPTVPNSSETTATSHHGMSMKSHEGRRPVTLFIHSDTGFSQNTSPITTALVRK